MRILLIAIGSTGDVVPMLSLGKVLRQRGHDVSLAAFEALAPLVEGAGIAFVSLPGDAQLYIGSIIKPGANPLTFLSRLEASLKGFMAPLFDAVWAACQQADALVTSFFGASIYAMAEALGKPLFQSNYCLTDMTGDHCLPIMPQPRWGRAMNRLTYRIAYRMIALIEKRYAVPICKAYGMPVRTMAHGQNYRIGDWTVPVLYAFSELVVPRPPEWPDNIHIVGFWEDEPDTGAALSPALEAFIVREDTPLVYIGFGSMTSGDMGEALRAVLQALTQNGMRAVLSPGWGGMEQASMPDNVYVVHEFVSHLRLFRHMDGVVHHGGAGTTAAGLIAGKPTLIVPFGSDQYFWGDRVFALECGPKPLPRTKLKSDCFATALHALVTTKAYTENADLLGKKLRAEHGPAAAADIIETQLATVFNIDK